MSYQGLQRFHQIGQMAAKYPADNIGKMAQYSLFSLYKTGQVLLFVFFFLIKTQKKYYNPFSRLGIYMCLITQTCPTLCKPMDYSLPGSYVYGDSPGKNLEWVAMPSLQGVNMSHYFRNSLQINCLVRKLTRSLAAWSQG